MRARAPSGAPAKHRLFGDRESFTRQNTDPVRAVVALASTGRPGGRRAGTAHELRSGINFMPRQGT
ncbi:hypothetical protein [Streptomyces sp. Y7]|uniref:hypothetical protein n=1 Tax=Streptomyces sp. Y7 TaxID=3342392 RepID=UPI00372182F7